MAGVVAPVSKHTFRLFKQVLGWTAPKIRDLAAPDRWSWLIIACLTQLGLAASRRRPAPPLGRPRPAGPAHPGPGRPRIPEHPRYHRLPSRCAETRQARPRTASRLEEPPPGRASRRRQAPQNGHARGLRQEAERLNGKLSRLN